MEMFRFSKHLDPSAESTTVLPPRNISIRNNESVENTVGLSNAISTTKYSLITWLPVSVWEQFRRIANAYFLIISILMLIGEYATFLYQTPLNPYSTVGTLLFVLLVTSLKEGYEDYQRYNYDKEENNRKFIVVKYENGVFVETMTESKNIKAGDVIKLVGRTPVPADILLLITSNYIDGNQCYIETANIDGETNLKVREAPVALLPLCSDGMIKTQLINGKLEFEEPNKDIHSFVGALHIDALSDPIALGPENIVLRGALFSNTDWAYAVALYTGQETKIQMNNRHADSKMSKIEGYLNTAIIIIFFGQVILVSISVISIYALGFQYVHKLPYVNTDGKLSRSVLPLWLENWFVFLLLYNNLIPISLYVTIELVNIGQSLFVASDENMYDEKLNLPCSVRSLNLCQELGLVSNIFSDKTGTLTRNEMKLVKFIVDGNMYDIGTEVSVHGEMVKSPVMYLLSEKNGKGEKIFDFLRCLTVCHTVVRQKDGTYRAESPDELALVEGVAGYDCRLLERGTASMSVVLVGKETQYDILAVNAFNADRKRMSIVVRNQATNEYLVLCKGADNIMLPLCNIDTQTKRSIEKSLLDLANFGLRTLVIAQKKLSTDAANAWLSKFKAAASSLQDRNDKLAAVAAELESQMELIGITAIEDRLQDEVPEVIADLAKAKIVLWMLTGDKEETAVNIGRSCNLVLNNTKLFFISRLDTPEAYKQRLEEVFKDIIANYSSESGYVDDGVNKEIALVMDGPSFRFFDENDKLQRLWLLKIGKHCRSVIACRLTPVQKQQLVALVKKDTVPRAITLAIGDGANDVPMIREGDVGIGIFGKEGRQAANNADFAIGQFKYLRRLLLVHGRWNYSRQSRVFLYSMHKNMVITLTLFWYSYYTAVSGTSTYESWVYASYNFVLGLPIIFYGIQDRDISDTFACKNPQVYATGTDNVYLTPLAIGSWILNAALYSSVLCLIFYYAMADTFQYMGLYSAGTTIFTGMCNALQLKVAFMMHQWTWPQAFVFFLSIWGMMLYNFLDSHLSDDYWYIADKLYPLGVFWLMGFFFVPLFTVLIDVVTFYTKFFFFPTREMRYRESEHIEEYLRDCLSKQDQVRKVKQHQTGSLPNGENGVHVNHEDVYKNTVG